MIDASVLANALADDGPDGASSRTVIRSAGRVVAPDLVDVETAAVLRKQWLRGRIDDRRFARALSHLVELDFERVPTRRLIARLVDIADNVGAYDACYVALAERLGCELVTADARLRTAVGPRCAIRVLGG